MMIVRHGPGHLVLVTQDDHARLAGRFAEALAEAPGPRGLFEVAVAEHDNGWVEYDAEPLLDPAAGVPFDFKATPAGPYVEIWRRGIARAAEVDPYVGLLVSLHGMRFFAHREDAASRALYAGERARQDRVLEELGLGGAWDDLPGGVAAHFDLLRFLDGLSLFFCDGWPGPWRGDVAGERWVVRRVGEHEVVVDPFPFEGVVEHEVPARRLPRGAYASREAFLEDFGEAGAVGVRARVRPP